MKKLVFGSLAFLSFSLAQAQSKTIVKDDKAKTESGKGEAKVKKTSTLPQKVNNAIRPKHKKYSGVKAKAKKKD